MNLIAFIDFINIFIAVYFGALIYSNDPSNKLNRVYLLYALTTAYTSLCEYFKFTAINESWAIFWHEVSFVWSFYPLLYLLLAIILYNDKIITKRKYIVLVFLPAIFIALLHLFVKSLYSDLRFYWYGWRFETSSNVFSFTIALYFIIYGTFAIFFMVKYYLGQKNRKKRIQALYAVVGLSIPIIGGLISEGILPHFNLHPPPLNSFFSIIGTTLLSISILKYKFFISDPSKTIDKLFGEAKDFLIIINQDLEIISVSKSLLNCLKYDEDEVVGKKIDGFVTANAQSSFNFLLDTSYKESELYLIGADSKLLPISSTISQIENNNRHENYYLLIGRDLSERKRYEYDLFLIHKELEDKIVKRTDELLQTNNSLQAEIREKNLIEKALRESELKYRNIFDYAPIGIFQSKPDGILVIANPTFIKILGYNSAEEINQLNMNDIYHDKSERNKLIDQNLHAGFIIGYQVRWKRKDGLPIWIQLSAHAVKNKDDQIEYFESFIIDISIQKSIEEEYRKSEERYRNLFENSPIGIYRTTPDGQILLANPALIAMLRFESFEDLAVRNLESEGYSEHNYSRNYFKNEIEGKGNIKGLESKWKRKDGSEISVRENARSVTDNNGNVFYDGTVEDITEYIMALEILKESEEKFRILAEQSHNMIAIYQDNKIEYINDYGVQLLGYEKELLLDPGFDNRKHFTKESLSGIDASREKFLQGESVTFQDCTLITKKGIQVNVILTLKQIIYRRKAAFLAIITDISDRISVEKSLRESEERYRGLIENINEIYFVSNSEGKTVYISKNIISFSGYPVDYFIGKSSFALTYKDDFKRVFNFYQEKKKDGTIDASIEFRAIKKDGTLFWIEQISRFIRDDTGKVVEFRSVARDITERKMAEEKIQLLAQAFRSTGEAISITDLNNDLLFVNDAFMQIYGYKENELIGNNIELVHSKSNPEPVLEEIRISTVSGNWSGELINRKKDGTDFPIFLSTSCVYNDKGIPYALVGVARDISERHRIEKQLEEYRNHLELLVEERTKKLDTLNKQLKEEIKKQIESEEKIQYQLKFLQTLIDTIPNPVYIRSDKKVTIGCNKAYELLTGLSQKELLGRTVYQLPSMKYAKFVDDKDDELLQNPGEQKYESVAIGGDGTEYNVIIFKATFNKVDGSIGGIVGIIVDISEIKKLEKEIRVALEKEKELSQLKSRFISVASHEFRTPLTTILSSADLLEMYGLEWPISKYLDYIAKIQNSVEYMTGLINDVLTLNKAEVGKFEFNPKMSNLYQIINNEVENATLNNNDRIKINFNFEPEQTIFNFDEKLVKQIVSNILSNAVKYSPQNGVVMLKVKQENEYLELSIEDKGIGINENDLSLLTEPFYRGGNVGSIKGTGLGLSIARKSAELHGGKLLIESQLNKGTKVTIILKLQNI